MEDKPKINFHRFQPKKMAAKYWIKWLFYGLILLSLWFWYKHQMAEKKLHVKTEKTKELRFEKLKIQE